MGNASSPSATRPSPCATEESGWELIHVLSVEETRPTRPSQGKWPGSGPRVYSRPPDRQPTIPGKPDHRKREESQKPLQDAGLHPVIGACVVSDRILIARE